ncbi:hypothetical protein KL86PLE_10073 [uncultured Pleomorphomonas sp.]|uniref:Uncharacterized protein n=1 Tax=uncultured Pleomorphomonas sp. TaxID=442121 RepID=A0A212KYJ8_9HYPH|nr:hypothetical protein KL86PLE_10073 [uncultured Pleomorphomonas sp.]
MFSGLAIYRLARATVVFRRPRLARLYAT